MGRPNEDRRQRINELVNLLRTRKEVAYTEIVAHFVMKYGLRPQTVKDYIKQCEELGFFIVSGGKITSN